MDTKLYSTLVNDIKNKIISGELSPGERLPSENELLDMYNLSKTTIAKSLQILANEGYIVTVPRVGNYVSKPKLSEYHIHYDTDETVSKISDSSTLIRFNRELIEAKYKHALRAVYLHTNEDDSVCIVENHIRFNGDENLTEKELSDISFYNLLKRFHNLHALSKTLTIESIFCPSEFCMLMKLEKTDTILKVIAVYRDETNELVAASAAHYRSDMSELLLSEC